MIERIDQIIAEVDATLPFLGKDRPGEIFRECKVEEFLPGRANVQRARRVPQRPLHRTHECCWIDVGLAAGRRRRISGRAATLPQRITQRHSRHDVGSHHAIEEHAAELVWISNEVQERKTSMQAQQPGHGPPSNYLGHYSCGMTEKLSPASDRKVPNTCRRKVVLDVKG